MVEYSDQQRFCFREEFEKRQLRHRVIMVLASALVLAFAFGLRLSGIWGPVTLVAACGAVVFDRRNWRCAACSIWLGRRWSCEFCPACGIGLSDRIELNLVGRELIDAGSDLQKSDDKGVREILIRVADALVRWRAR